jgi:hypothetical protein
MAGKLSNFAGMFNAFDFAYGVNPRVPGIQVIGPVGGATGVQTVVLAHGYVNLSDGTIIYPLSTSAPILVGGDSTMETVTPSAVSNSTPTVYASTSVTFTGTYAHSNGDSVRSGTVGLQEALNYCASQGGGQIIVDGRWAAAGGTSAMLAAAVIPAGVSIDDNRAGASASLQTVQIPLTLAQIQAAFTTPILVIPAPGAGNLIDVIDATMNLVFGSAAYVGGGAAQLSYGTALTYPATATWAATDYTSLAANQEHKVAGVLATTPSANCVNTAIYYSNATAVFTAGTGGSGLLTVTYRTINGQK